MKEFKVQNSKFKVLFLFVLFFLFLLIAHNSSLITPAYAANCPDSSKNLITNPLPNTDPAAQAILQVPTDNSGNWDCDDEVTFTGKMAARSGQVLDWLLDNYHWSTIKAVSAGQETPFDVPYKFIRFVVYAILGLFILVAAFLMIITRGRSITVRRFIIRFIFVAVFVWFSFSIVSTIYFLADIVQGFFLVLPQTNEPISTKDLLNISFGYEEFQGYRKLGPEFNESAITSLLLIKATAATYYTMFVILIIRKVILWFFILVSPVFPLLLFFKPVRNTAKIWIGEFFRWTLYAPLFAIFLRGLVEIWKFGSLNITGIPLAFHFEDVKKLEKIVYPTSINITLGGPSQELAGHSNINFVDTFVLYLVALIMLWTVIIMPWILLRIFLDYFNRGGEGEGNLLKFLAKNSGPLGPLAGRYLRPLSPSPVGTPPEGPPPGQAGLAKSIPMTRFKHTPVAEIQQQLAEAEARQSAQVQAGVGAFSQTAQNIAEQTRQDASQQYSSSMGQLFSGSLKIPDLQTQQITAEILNLSNLNIPTMKDIARYEASMMSSSASATTRQEVSKMNEMLSRLSGQSPISSPQEKAQFGQIRQRLITESTKGNPVAKSMVAATTPGGGAALPEENSVQQVNLDDYEEVKKTWEENYRNLESPMGPDGKPQDKKVWLKSEVAQIPKVIDLLLSGDPQKQEEGKRMVSKILPFLLLGGFSKAEIVAYLKAKLEAAKAVLNEVLQVEAQKEEEETKVEVKREDHAQAQAVMHAEAQIPEEAKKPTDADKKPPS